jgi:hypothetical protein
MHALCHSACFTDAPKKIYTRNGVCIKASVRLQIHVVIENLLTESQSIFIPIAFRLAHIFSTPTDDREDYANDYITAILMAVEMNALIVVTCIPFLKAAMDHLQPGWSTSDIRKGVGFTVAYGKAASPPTYLPSGSVLAKGDRMVDLRLNEMYGAVEQREKPLKCSSEPEFITSAMTSTL